MKAITEIDGSDTVTVRALTTADHGRLATALLDAAGPDRKREVRSTSKGGRGFQVPLDIAQAAGFVPPAEDSESGDAPTADDGQGDEKPGADSDSKPDDVTDEQPVEDVPEAADDPVPAKPARRPRGKATAAVES